MKILAVDTSTKIGSIALLDGANVISETALNIEVTHSEKLLPAIEKIFAETGWDFSKLEGLAVAIGPGSFTGLRIGLATMKGFAQAQNIPLVGISSLMALAYSASTNNKPIMAILKAGRGEVYATAVLFKDGILSKIIIEEQAINPELLTKTLTQYEPYLTVGEEQIKARSVGILGLEKLKRGEGKNWAGLVPNYLRKSDAEK